MNACILKNIGRSVVGRWSFAVKHDAETNCMIFTTQKREHHSRDAVTYLHSVVITKVPTYIHSKRFTDKADLADLHHAHHQSGS